MGVWNWTADVGRRRVGRAWLLIVTGAGTAKSAAREDLICINESETNTQLKQKNDTNNIKSVTFFDISLSLAL